MPLPARIGSAKLRLARILATSPGNSRVHIARPCPNLGAVSDQHKSQPGERTTLNAAFLGFYASCTLFGLGTAVAAACLIVFNEYSFANWLAALSLVVVVFSGFASWYCLKIARKE